MGAEIGQQVAAGEPIHVSPTEQLLNLTLGQAPFAAAYLTKGGRVPWGGAATRAHVGELEHAIELTRGLEGLRGEQGRDQREADARRISPIRRKACLPTMSMRRSTTSGLQTKALEEEGSALGQEKQGKLADEESVLVKTQGAQPGNIFGAQIMPDTPRTDVTGTVVRETPGWRMIRVADDPRNGELAGSRSDLTRRMSLA